MKLDHVSTSDLEMTTTSSMLRSVPLAFTTLIALSAGAQSITHYQEPGLNSGRSYVSHTEAEVIDPFTGNLQMQHRDLAIPGNGGFDLVVRRAYNLLKISEANSPFGRGWDIHFGRVKSLSGAARCDGVTIPKDLVLELPDGSEDTLYRSDVIGGGLTTAKWITTKLWKGKCTADGAHVVLLSPDGTQYAMTEKDGAYWHAKTIADRYGNSATLSYTPVAQLHGRKAVTQVLADDGRRLVFSYETTSKRLSSIDDGSQARRWDYTVTQMSGYYQLTKVAPPDGGPWVYDYYQDRGSADGSYAIRYATNPYGGRAEYEYSNANFLSVIAGSQNSTVVASKKITHQSGIKTWTYTFDPGCGQNTDDVTTVTLPDSFGTIKYKHTGYCTAAMGQNQIWKIGLLREKTSTGGGTTQVESYDWVPLQVSTDDQTRPNYGPKADSVTNRALLQKRTIQRDGTTYTNTYSDFDAFGNPGRLVESGTRNRTHDFEYFNVSTSSSWIVGVLTKDTIQGLGMPSLERLNLNAAGDPGTEKRFNIRRHTLITATVAYTKGRMPGDTGLRSPTT